eukprot:m.42173 g.42173  ORF g.42173 m.42173 type:complete len:588 (-) comp10653_c0_seq3:575-2338(-)
MSLKPPARRRARAASTPVHVGWLIKFDPPGTPPAYKDTTSDTKGKFPKELTDHYSLGYTIGDGGFARVKLARHRVTGIRVAVKMIDKATLIKKNELFRAANEIAALQLLKHKNIAKLFQVLESKTKVYLVMEHMPAGELFDYIVAQGRIARESDAKKLFRQIVSAVAFCHQEGFAHRDLKPENMLFDEQKTLKLIDFGLVSMPGTDFTQTSCGSANYAAPEVINGAQYASTGADIWSLGIILYAMLCGVLPFDNPDLRTLGSLIRAGKYSEPAFLSGEAKDLISKLLQVDPNKRIKMPDLLQHPWIVDDAGAGLNVGGHTAEPLDLEVVDTLARFYGTTQASLVAHINAEPYDHVTADYELFKMAKAKCIPLQLVERGGKYNPRHLPQQVEERGTDSSISSAATSRTDSPMPIKEPVSPAPAITSTASATAAAPASAPAKKPVRGRRRGKSEAPPVKFDVDAAAEVTRDPGWLATKFDSLRTLATPLIVHDQNLGLNYKTKSEPEELRLALLAHLEALPGEVKIKKRMYRLDVALNNDMTGNHEIRLHFEIVKILSPEMTGVRVTRVKGDRADIATACQNIFKDFTG